MCVFLLLGVLLCNHIDKPVCVKVQVNSVSIYSVSEVEFNSQVDAFRDILRELSS